VRLAIAILLVACGDNRHLPAVPDAAPPAACTATYTGNLDERATAPDPCVAITGRSFAATVPSTLLDAPLAMAIDLGATATAGDYTSAAVGGWSATGTRTVDHHACTYSAGSAAAPHGSFTLALDAAGHGRLTLETYVLADPNTACGDPITQDVELAF